jgi:hypothetical protein
MSAETRSCACTASARTEDGPHGRRQTDGRAPTTHFTIHAMQLLAPPCKRSLRCAHATPAHERCTRDVARVLSWQGFVSPTRSARSFHHGAAAARAARGALPRGAAGGRRSEPARRAGRAAARTGASSRAPRAHGGKRTPAHDSVQHCLTRRRAPRNARRVLPLRPSTTCRPTRRLIAAGRAGRWPEEFVTAG